MIIPIENLVLSQIIFAVIFIPVGLYNVFVLLRVLMKGVDGSRYILILLVSLTCYTF